MKQEFERLGVGYWQNREENSRHVWREVSRSFIDTGR
jgi:hypothetical protein